MKVALQTGLDMVREHPLTFCVLGAIGSMALGFPKLLALLQVAQSTAESVS